MLPLSSESLLTKKEQSKTSHHQNSAASKQDALFRESYSMYNIRRPSDIPFLQRKILSKDFNEAVFQKLRQEFKDRRRNS